MKAIVETKFDLPFFSKGKVRDIYDMKDSLLIIVTDRISAFDYVLPTPIPDKGKVLNQISEFWFNQLADIVPHHLITDKTSELPESAATYADKLAGRFMIVKKAEKFPVECIVRGYLSGSGWKEYQKKGSICGIELPKGLRESEKLPEPIFTPTTKEDGDGKHDENITLEEMGKQIGIHRAKALKDISIALYKKALRIAEKQGIIIADTKFEFGMLDSKIILIDEVLTPDSSRFWDKSSFAPGKSQPSYDKQFIRDYLESVNWNKQPPAPELPTEIVEKTRDKYIAIYKRLTNKELQL